MLSWLELQHIWTKLRPVKEKLVRGASASPIQIARDVSSSHRNILTLNLDLRPHLLPSSVGSAFEERFISETGCRLADSAVSHQW